MTGCSPNVSCDGAKGERFSRHPPCKTVAIGRYFQRIGLNHTLSHESMLIASQFAADCPYKDCATQQSLVLLAADADILLALERITDDAAMVALEIVGGDAFTVAVPDASKPSALEKAKEDAAAVAVSVSNEG